MSRGKRRQASSILVPEACRSQGQTYGEAVTDWLQKQRWDYFVTVTTRRPRRDAVALIRDVVQVTGDVERIFLACEPHKYSSNLYAHGLVAELEPAYLPERSATYGLLSRQALWHDYFRTFGRSRVETVKDMGRVSAYCAKYVTKWTDGDNFDFIGDNWEK